KANKAYFLLGNAIHALEDSFSSEHTQRTGANLAKIREHKTYVGTPNVPEHRHDFGGTPEIPARFDKRHGDKPYTRGNKAEASLKDTARAAVVATKEFFEAFQQARAPGAAIGNIFQAFATKWLDLENGNDATLAQCRHLAHQANPNGAGLDYW